MTLRFRSALTSAACPVIMEVKRHDGHGCDLLGDRDILDLVSEYEQAGAPCLSVVTGRWFGGSQQMLDEVRGHHPAGAAEGLHHQCPACPASRGQRSGRRLLTATLLVPSCLQELVDCALATGLTPFVEVADADEVRSVPQAGQCVVAVNNKDIRHRERGPGTVERSLALLPAVLASGTRCAVSASGIDRPEDASALIRRGYAGVLVGRSVLQSASVRDWAARVRATIPESVPA